MPPIGKSDTTKLGTMARRFGKLTDLKIRGVKPAASLQKLTDGGGLQFWVTPQGSRYWRLDYRFAGKRKLLALGVYPDVGLSRARGLAEAARAQIAEGKDPCQLRKDIKQAAVAKSANSFSSLAKSLVNKKRREGRADITISKIEWILAKVDRDLGPLLISEITTPQIIRALQREEAAGNLETARRMRTVLGEVFRYAIQTGICTNDPVAATKGAIARQKTRHHAAIIEPMKLAKLLLKIEHYAQNNVIVGSALILMALLFPRPGELRQAHWSEFDLGEARWAIPAARMKMRQTHIVPLSRQSVEILERLFAITGPEGFVFPAIGSASRCMSENTMNIALRRMGISGEVHTSHGFRATASTLLNASGKFSIDAIERSLAHQDKDAVRRAYARGDHMNERVVMLQWWSDHLDELKAGVKEEPTLSPLT